MQFRQNEIPPINFLSFLFALSILWMKMLLFMHSTHNWNEKQTSGEEKGRKKRFFFNHANLHVGIVCKLTSDSTSARLLIFFSLRE